MTKTNYFLLAGLCLILACKNGVEVSDKLKMLQTCLVEGTKDSVYCGNLEVWENRTTKTGRKIRISVTVIPALKNDSAGPPIFYFEGGPGIAASKNVTFFANKEIPYRQYHDIVLIDIRGTGKSNPLNCYLLQYKAGLQETLGEMYPLEDVKNCFDSLSLIADLTQYTTSIIADDIDEVRQWLGYKKIHLFGLSYGTKLAQEYLRRYESAVESVVLFSPAIMNSEMPLHHAAFAQQSFDQLVADCKKDSACRLSFPDLENEFNTLMEKGRKDDFVANHTMNDGTTKKIIISWNAFQTKIRSMLYMPATQRSIPFIIHQASLGNWKPFLSKFREGASYDDFIADGLYLCITCAEDVPFISDDETDSLTRNTFMGTYRVDQQKRACSIWSRGTLSADYLKPVKSAVPVLIFSGAIDPVTPTSWAKQIASTLSNCTMVVIPNMAHTFDGLSNEICFDEIALAFMANPSVPLGNTDCVYQMKPPVYQVK